MPVPLASYNLPIHHIITSLTIKQPEEPPTAHLVFLHGFSDHINAYYDLFPTLASPPYSLTIHGFDQRGWGRSVHTPSSAGLTGPTPQVLSDIRSFILSIAPKLTTPEGDTKPLFLMGHSMGGGQALHFLLTTSPSYLSPPLPPIAGLILESPYISLHPSSQPSSLTVTVGKLAGRLLPNRQLKQKLDATYMSRDAKVRQDWIDDPLCHDTGTLAGLAGMLGRAADLVGLTDGTAPHLTKKLPCPLLLLHGDEDRVTSYEASKALFEKLEAGVGMEKKFASYEGGYHKMHVEPEGKGEEFARDVGEWIVKVAKGGVEGQEEGGRYVAGEGQGEGDGRVSKL
jgi:acylglycerol lipase